MPFFSVARMVEASKRFGLTVEVVPGAETRGSSAFNPFGFVGHHTGGAKTGDRPSLALCVNGRPDLDGPLCNDFLTRAGVDVIVAAGRANHAGIGGFRSLVGNSSMWGCEAEDDGDGTWTEAQLWAYPRMVAARLWLIGRDASWYCSHRTWALTPPSTPGRKIDPKGISDEWMRTQTTAVLNNPILGDDMAAVPQDQWDALRTSVERIENRTAHLDIAGMAALARLDTGVPRLLAALTAAGVDSAKRDAGVLAFLAVMADKADPVKLAAELAKYNVVLSPTTIAQAVRLNIAAALGGAA